MAMGESLQQYATPNACDFILPNAMMLLVCVVCGVWCVGGEEFHKKLRRKCALFHQRKTTASPCTSGSIVEYVIAVLVPVILLARLTVPLPGYVRTNNKNTQQSQQLNVAHTIRSR